MTEHDTHAEYIIQLKHQKDGAYSERDQLVAALSKVFPSHLKVHEDDPDWESDWRTVVCIHLPTGQACWHIRRDERPWFSHLDEYPCKWDGHSTEEKYRRLAGIEGSACSNTAD